MKQKARSRELSPVGTLKKRRRQKEVDLLQCQQLTGLWNSLQSNIRKITSIATCLNISSVVTETSNIFLFELFVIFISKTIHMKLSTF